MASPPPAPASTTGRPSLTAKENAIIVLVQGSFQTPSVYQPLGQRIRSLGYSIVHPSLPSCTNVDDPSFPSTTLIDDALAIRLELIRQVEYEHRLVVVVMHSYGGLVGSEAVPKELTYADRKARGLSGGVVHLFYFSAFILPAGKSVLEVFGESPNNDVKTKLTRAAYKYTPSTYLICENDQAAPLQYQEMFAATAGAEVDKCNSGHSPMLSQTELLADKIVAVTDAAVKKANQGM
ncbi:hypothetical protein ACMFMG_004367 [Clarireedia jacksonii]